MKNKNILGKIIYFLDLLLIMLKIAKTKKL